MLVPLAAAARFRPVTNSTFKPESTVDSKNKPILKESPLGPPSPRGGGENPAVAHTFSENGDLVMEEDPE